MRIINCIDRIYDSLINFGVNHITAKHELNAIIKHSGKERQLKYFNDWIQKWRALGPFNKDYYRVFSQYIGENINIVPDDLLHNVIEPILNPKRFISVYEDKNVFDKMLWSSFGKKVTPTTYLRNIGGLYYDSDYHLLYQDYNLNSRIPINVNSILVKPSLDSSSGKSIAFLHRNESGIFEDIDTKEILTKDYLIRHFKRNYIVQEVMKQSPFMNHLSKTSVNTLRIAVYRSVKSGKTEVINTIVRIGKEGSLVDNAHAGGVFVGVNDNGKLGEYCCNQYGEKIRFFNGIDFAKESLVIPNYGKIKEFACKVGDAMLHQHLVALDVMLNEEEEPILIEYNIRGFSVWLFQFTNGVGFGKYTNEIIEYCTEHRNEATRISVIF